MTTELAVITEDGEVVERRAPMTLFGTDNPAAVVERASAVATSLGAVINERKLFASIGGKKHVQVEGWTLLGSMLGVFAEVEWSRPLENGWEARAVARTLNGNVVGAAEAMCTVDEKRWNSADTYAVRSMAQTRAVSKALRMPLGFIMHLAGYSATPAEEVPDEPTAPRERPAKAQRSPEEQELLDRILAIPGMSHARMSLMAEAVGVPKGERANAEQLRAMLALDETPEPARAHAEAPATASVDSPPGQPAPSPSELLEQAAAITGGELVEADPPFAMPAETAPPKPGTSEYRALPSGVERSQAKSYWDAKKEAEPEPETLAEQLRVEA